MRDGVTAVASNPSNAICTSASTGVWMRLVNRATASSALSASVTISLSPRPARAISSMSQRLTLLPMPKLKTRVVPALARTAATMPRSLPTKASVRNMQIRMGDEGVVGANPASRTWSTRSPPTVAQAPDIENVTPSGLSTLGSSTGLVNGNDTCGVAWMHGRPLSCTIEVHGTSTRTSRPSAGRSTSAVGVSPAPARWTRAASIAFIISVPPPPRCPPMNACACATVEASAGRGSGQSTCVSPAKVITLNVSTGRIAPIAFDMTSLAFSMGNPLMLPLVSRTKMSSRAGTSAGATAAGGATTSVR